MTAARSTDFDDWLVATFNKVGSFTMLIVLVEIGETSVTLLRSSYLHVVGDETRWPEMVRLFAASGAPWNGAAFFRADRGGLVNDGVAKKRLAELVHHLQGDRSLLNEGEFFDAAGLRLKVEEIIRH
ncbi:MAG TPA: hypothetical protein VGH40_14940 [Roseiarcus sp.]|jgi:hypothetical protein